ncbi:MAG: dephospho-CoA kinase [Candidatus Alcyoniella australis]|nr:dephospho-CoA kinase [Candidatus Alcyoniella australis]
MKIYGLTGGIASGKSTAAKVFAKLGATVIDADQVARDVMAKGQSAFDRVVAEFGSGIVGPDGEIDRRRLREQIFTDPDSKAKLDEISHPLIIGSIVGRVRDHFEHSTEPVIVEAALLIETEHPFPLSGLIVVYCTQRKQIQRLIQRDGVDEQQAQAALDSQMPMKEKLDYADFAIRNNGSLEALQRQVERLWQTLKSQH